MDLNKEIEILGRKMQLTSRPKEQLKGLTVGETLSYNYYDGTYQNVPMLFLEPKKGNPTPKQCEITEARLSERFQLPVIFILAPGPTYERQRLMDKGVYFIMSGKYAHLPMLVAIEKTSNRKVAKTLNAVAQYLLCYHLQERSLEGLSAKEIAPLVPYSYESVSLGLSCLADLNLCKKASSGNKTKTIHFEAKGIKLWEIAQQYLSSPIEHRFYCDGIHTDEQFSICGINALAHYSRLNPDSERIIMMTTKEYREYKSKDMFENPNIYDGAVIVEVWKYPAVQQHNNNNNNNNNDNDNNNNKWVDKLSLILSLKDNNDPRVEGELDQLIKEIEWKD